MRSPFGLALWLLLLASNAWAGDADEDAARRLYGDGKSAYQLHQYQRAHDQFKEAYRLSHAPELLYDIASCLQQLHRPHDAAETLRAYVRVLPNEPERAQIEERIRALDEEERLFRVDGPPGQPPELRAPAAAAAKIAPIPAHHGPAGRAAVGLGASGVVLVAVGGGLLGWAESLEVGANGNLNDRQRLIGQRGDLRGAGGALVGIGAVALIGSGFALGFWLREGRPRAQVALAPSASGAQALIGGAW